MQFFIFMKSLRNKSNGNESFILKALVALAVLLAVMAISACFGSSNISLSDIFAYVSGVNKSSLKESTITILGEIRFPRIIMSALVGGSLASIGAIMQGIFKNPMADPSVLGISSGSALGATIAIVIGVGSTAGIVGLTGTYLGAIIGALVTWLLVWFLARANSGKDLNSTLLSGIAIGSIMSALITVLMTLNMKNMEQVYMCILGTFSNSTLSKTQIMLFVSIPLVLFIILLSPQIDVLKLGDEAAVTLGVNPKRLTGVILSLCSILLAFCVANSGIIGFVGLIIPHCVSFLKVYKMRQKVIMSILMGMIFLVVCDLIARTITAPSEMAIGAITSLIGAPYFLIMIWKEGLVGKMKR